MLKRLQVRDFKSLRELEVEFGRLTVLVGANGCGKSSVLQAIKLVRDLALAEPADDDPFVYRLGERDPDAPQLTGVSVPGSMLSRPLETSKPPESFAMQLAFEAGFDVEANLYPTYGDPQYLEPQSKIVCRKANVEWHQTFASYAPDWVLASLDRVELYQLDKRIMEQPTYSDEADPPLGTQGENLAAVLDALQGSQREQFEAIEAQLCQFIPGLRRVRLHRVRMPRTREVLVGTRSREVEDAVVGHQVVLDFEFARSVVADQASEGTILLLGLLTVIGAEPSRSMTIMLDDLDRALHPKAQRQLVEHLHTLLDQRSELQIIATSHSPYLVEHLAYEEVLAMTQSPTDGRSLIAPLASHPDADRWRDEMSAGEFWSSVGEDWIHQAKAQ